MLTMSWLGVPREAEIWLTFALFMIMRYRHASTTEGFISTFFVFFKLLILVFTWFMSTRLLVWYCIVFAVLLISNPGPRFNWNDNLVELSDSTFESVIKNGRGSNHWAVIFYPPWDMLSKNLVPSLCDMAERYSTKHLRFAYINITYFPELAKQFNIQLDSESYQYPTVILFHQGKEVRRVPLPKQEESMKLLGQSVSPIQIVRQLQLASVAKDGKLPAEDQLETTTKKKK